ncbi:PDDEXK nuclease domain-containing protein [Pirellulaceae bacterium SH449]
MVQNLSSRLTQRYGKGFSSVNLWLFRQFYQAFGTRVDFLYPAGRESAEVDKFYPAGRELTNNLVHNQAGVEFPHSFSPQLSWSHYRALMRVQETEARDFYEREAAECGWTKAQLERQIQSSYYQRIIANRGKEALIATDRERLPGDPAPIEAVLKTPYVLEFLGLPDSPKLHESDLEQAVIDNLQSFLLELGKGFCFVARQKHIRFDDDDFYIDLVFYNYLLKCFLLIDLKIGKLTHRDIGQMDGYVRAFEDRYKVLGDNPTIGLILCSDKSEAVAKYSILSEAKQVFASKYVQFLPTEEELKLELQRERKLIESALEERREMLSTEAENE